MVFEALVKRMCLAVQNVSMLEDLLYNHIIRSV